MINRPLFPKEKNVFVIVDVPTKKEIEDGEKFASPSNMNLLTSLRTGRVSYNGIAPEGHRGINPTDIFSTYVDYNGFAEGNFDFVLDFRKRKDVEPSGEEGIFLDKEDGSKFYKLPHQKDVYISERLWDEITSLINEIRIVKPKLTICTGKWSLFFLTGCTTLGQNLGNWKDKKPFGGLAKFRASILKPHECWELEESVLIPIYHPVNAMAMPDKASIMELDVQRVGWVYNVIMEYGVEYFAEPKKTHILGTDKEVVLGYLAWLLYSLNKEKTKISLDIETMFHSTIDCIGLAASIDEGICIPFAHMGNANFWNKEDELEILCKLVEVLQHKNALFVGQNLSYDIAYIHKFWGIRIDAFADTMVLSHVLYNHMQKDLAFLASLYCTFFQYWKDDVTATAESPDTRWIYNIKDILYTLEIEEVLQDQLAAQPKHLQDFYRFQQFELAPALLDMMQLGVDIDLAKKESLHKELGELLVKIERMINDLLGMEINLKSSAQVKALFKDFLGVTPVVDRKRKTESFGSAAMLVYLEQYPLYRPLITLILEYRSIGIFVRTFLSAKVDEDNRMRTSYNLAGTKTYRLASRKNAFGRGANLQNLPSKGKIDLKYAIQVYDEVENENEDTVEDIIIDDTPVYSQTELPNIKDLFICQEDEMFFDIDLAAADARIIAWTSGCKFLTELFEDPNADLYSLLAGEYTGRKITKKDKERQWFKAVAHASNYLGKSKTIAAKEGMLVHEVDRVQEFYFDLCPEIPKLHKEVEKQVKSRGYLENVWGARGWFLDRNDPMLMNKAMAWVGSSPVSILINKALVDIHRNEPNIKLRLQVHDSLSGTYKKVDTDAPNRVVARCLVPLPFETPKVIPVNIKTGLTYGSCS